ncbi:MAG: sensor domain-containing diguanylate cyclase [candidate division Zixibacteria bacterium]|nr:sensor domain-containing diguanylate cyclase [candidate division Zixibacteria bacterium]
MYNLTGNSHKNLMSELTYFALARLLVILSCAVYILALPQGATHYVLAWVLLSGMGLHLGLYWWTINDHPERTTTFNRFTFLLDTACISIFCLATGGLNSPFFILFYLTIPYAAFSLNLSESLIFAFLATFIYLILHLNSLGSVYIGELIIRLGMIWFLAWAVSIFSKQSHANQWKLQNSLNTLTQRTQELEHSKVQIETIYEASRSLAKLMTLEQIIDKILSIVQQILGYKNFSILLLSNDKDALELKAKIAGGKTVRFEQTQKFNLSGVWGEVVRSASTERVLDIQTDPREVLSEKKDTRAQMTVPLVVGGKVYGILNAESERIGAFVEQDQKILSILANHAALAIENFDLHNRTTELTITDELTGTNNFRFFRNKLDDEFKRAKRYHQSLSLIMIDIDWFKKCNDTYGHQFGNLVLKELVRIVNNCIRDVDVCCRYGGEEFVVILPQTNKEDARQIGERIRVSFGQQLIELGNIKTRCTISIGIATFPEDASDPSRLIEKVDQALYYAKGHGKNQVWAGESLAAHNEPA